MVRIHEGAESKIKGGKEEKKERVKAKAKRKPCFFGKAFFKPFRKAFTENASLKGRFLVKVFTEGEKET